MEMGMGMGMGMGMEEDKHKKIRKRSYHSILITVFSENHHST
jgi:hypothetical protein